VEQRGFSVRGTDCCPDPSELLYEEGDDIRKSRATRTVEECEKLLKAVFH